MSLRDFTNQTTLILTIDGRTLVGDLQSHDQTTNLVLSNTHERIIRPPEDPQPSEVVKHGLYVVRGDNVLVIGLVDRKLDESIDWSRVRGAVVRGTANA